MQNGLFCIFCILCCFAIVVTGCERQPSEQNQIKTEMAEINDRNHTPLYRIRAPKNWVRRDPLPDEPLEDTRKAICEYFIDDPEGLIRITIHNFPSKNILHRPLPLNHVNRWQHQFDENECTESQILPQAFSGYQGLLFIGAGKVKQSPAMILAWAMQLGPEHYQALKAFQDDDNPYIQETADVTIKAAGPIGPMEKHKADIISMARSFELIEEIPDPI